MSLDVTRQYFIKDVTLETTPLDIAFDGKGTLWVVGEGARLYRIASESMTLTGTFTVGNAPVRVVVGPDRVWVGESGSPDSTPLWPTTVYGIDPMTGAITSTTKVGEMNDSIDDLVAATDGAVALVSNGFALARVTATGGILKLLVGAKGGYGYGALAMRSSSATDAFVVDAYTPRLLQIRLEDLTVMATAPIPTGPSRTLATDGKFAYFGYRLPDRIITSSTSVPMTAIATTPLDAGLVQITRDSKGRVYAVEVGDYGAVLEIDPSSGVVKNMLKGVFATRIATR
jgi:hypothetical protein